MEGTGTVGIEPDQPLDGRVSLRLELLPTVNVMTTASAPFQKKARKIMKAWFSLMVMLSVTVALSATESTTSAKAGLEEGLVAAWSFEQVEGETVGEVALAEGKRGQALALDGKGYVQPAVKNLKLTRGFTIEGWICPEPLTGGRVLDCATPAASDAFCLDTFPKDGLRLITPAGTITKPGVLQAGKWAHVAAVYDAWGRLALYLNGELVVEEDAMAGADVVPRQPLTIGADPQGNNRFAGRIDELRLYARPLTLQEVADRMVGKTPSRRAAFERSTRPICWRNGPQANMRNLLGRNDVVYLSPARYEHEALPVGNGRLCAMVWNANGLDLQLNHADNVWYQSSSGRVRLTADTDLFEGVEQFEQRGFLYDGAIRTRYRGKAGEWTAVITVLEGQDVAAIHFEGKVRGKLRLELEQWRPSAKRMTEGMGFVEELPVNQAKPFSRRQALMVAADCGMEPGEAVMQDSLTTIPVALNPQAAADGRVSFTVYIANVFTTAEGDPAARAAEALAAARRNGWEKNFEQTAAAWGKFWEKSFVHLTSPEGTADYMENLWFLHLYWMNCAGRGEFPVKFNGGLFLMHRDMRGWGSSYWYQNTRELYWPLLAANHLELCRPFHHLYRSVLPVQMEMTKRLFKVDGAQYEETMAIDGSGDKKANSYTCLYLTTGIELSLQLYRHYLYSRDEEYLKNTVWPILRETVRFYLNWGKKEDDGLYHIYPTGGKETWWRVKDAITDFAAMRRMFPIFIDLSRRYGVDKDLAVRCEDVLKALPSYPVDPEKGCWAPCTFLSDPPDTGNPVFERLYPPKNTSHSLKENKNSENVECEVIFPWELVGMGSEEKELEMALKTFRARRWQPAGGWDQGAVWAARLGSATEAVRNITAHAAGGQRWPQGFWNTPGGLYTASVLYDFAGFDPAGVNATSTSEMLLQSWDGRIRVWPAAPNKWNGVFYLRAQTGFMVTSERTGGEVVYVAVESLFGDACRITSPWKEEEWRVTRDGKEVARGTTEEIVFSTKKGQRYLVERSAAPIAEMNFAPLAPPVNHDVKRLQKSRDKSGTPVIGQPMLGITRDGLTPVRLQIQLNRETAEKDIREIVGDHKPLAIASAKGTDRKGAAVPAPWLIDGIFGIDRVPPALNYNVRNSEIQPPYVLELSKPSPVNAVVWSYDRRGVRCDFDGINVLKTILVETSVDGTNWTLAAEAAPKQGREGLYGQAIRIEKPAEAKFVRVSFRHQNGDQMHVPVDELEVYSIGAGRVIHGE
ncbi:MAG: hypothetical protein KKD33_06310 [Verrucomicrobia bacterium]|nr:hypothetical protein [Verrucomicrobiota bacterium]